MTQANDSLVQSIAFVHCSLIAPAAKELLNGDITRFLATIGN
jgi:hypothetical protein